jgi:methyl-accepting chemotaxis protein
MFKNLRLAAKIGLGFAALITIAVVLGSLAVYNMKSVETESTKLAKEYVPEVRIANELRSASNRVMYEMRGYGLTEDEEYHRLAQEELKAVDTHLKEAEDLAEKAMNLKALREQVKTAKAAVANYRSLVEDTVKVNGLMDAARKTLDENAAAYMQNCNSFLDSQNKAFKDALKDRTTKVDLVSDITDIGTKTRVLNFKSQATRDPALMQQAADNLKLVFEKTKALRPITVRAEDIKRIDDTEAAATAYGKALGNYLTLEKIIQKDQEKMDAAAKKYMENCNSFLADQNSEIKKEIRESAEAAKLEERMTKITLANDIIELGNSARVQNFKAQANLDSTMIHEAQKSLDAVGAKATALRSITRNTENLKQIDEILAAAKAYGEAMEEIEKSYVAMDAQCKQMDESAGIFVANCDEYFSSQLAALKTDMQDRHEKIIVVNDIIDLGNDTRIKAFKSQALQKPEIMADAEKNFPLMEEKFAALRKITNQEVNLKQIDATKQAAAGYRAGMGALMKAWNASNDIATKRGEAGKMVIAACKETADAGMEHTDQIANSAAASLSTSSVVMITGLLIALVVGILLAVVITMGITGPIKNVIAGLTSGSEQVSAAAGQVSSSSQQMAEGASEQASSLEEVSSSLEEMASMTRQNADNAKQANGMAGDSRSAADKGVEAMNRMSQAINDIKKSADQTAKIVKTIDEIAFQTNLLALNAAVEAARAGEAGKGFAVVAEEVRNLAQRSAEAAKNTAALIEESQKNSENGVSVTAEVGEILKQIAASAQKVTALIGEVSAASSEQAQGIDQVNTAVAQMDKVTQSNAANAEESASASEELSSQAQELNSMVEMLVGIVGGASAQRQNTRQSAAARSGGKSAKHVATNRVHALLHHEDGGKQQKRPSADHGAKVPVHAGEVSKPAQVIPLSDEELKEF